MSGRSPDQPDSDRRAPGVPEDDDLDTAAEETEEEAWAPEEDLGEPEVAEAVGATVDEAIANALEILGAREDEVEIEVLQTGQRGFMGLGKRRPFLVRVTWSDDLDEETIEEDVPSAGQRTATEGRAPVETSPPRRASEPSRPARPAPPRPAEPAAPRTAAPVTAPAAAPARPAGPSARPESIDQLAQKALAATEDLLRRMGMVATVRVSTSEGQIQVDVESDEDDALLIGRRGETRAAIEHLVQRLAIPRDEREVSVLVDVNGYWERRLERLRADALDLAAEALRDGQEVRTEPLSAQERRIIHRALVDDERVSTESIGTGALKRVAIIPTGNR